MTSSLFITSIEKGLTVLEAFRNHESLNLQEIARYAGISTSSAQRVAYTLEQLGYVNKDPGMKRYRLSVKAMSLGYTYLSNERLFHNAYTTLHQLNQECGESVNLSVPDAGDMVFVMRIHAFKHIPIYMPVGTRIPLCSSASGRAFLARLPSEKREALLRDAVMEKHTPHTTTDINILRDLIQQAQSDGYAYADEEFFLGDINVAASVLDHNGQPVASVNISVPKPRWTVEKARQELGPLVVRAARAIKL